MLSLDCTPQSPIGSYSSGIQTCRASQYLITGREGALSALAAPLPIRFAAVATPPDLQNVVSGVTAGCCPFQLDSIDLPTNKHARSCKARFIPCLARRGFGGERLIGYLLDFLRSRRHSYV